MFKPEQPLVAVSSAPSSSTSAASLWLSGVAPSGGWTRGGARKSRFGVKPGTVSSQDSQPQQHKSSTDSGCAATSGDETVVASWQPHRHGSIVKAPVAEHEVKQPLPDFYQSCFAVFAHITQIHTNTHAYSRVRTLTHSHRMQPARATLFRGRRMQRWAAGELGIIESAHESEQRWAATRQPVTHHGHAWGSAASYQPA